jgi:hypothetical protein
MIPFLLAGSLVLTVTTHVLDFCDIFWGNLISGGLVRTKFVILQLDKKQKRQICNFFCCFLLFRLMRNIDFSYLMNFLHDLKAGWFSTRALAM